MATLKLVCGLMLCMLVVEPMVTNALTCRDVARQLAPCINYLKNGRALPKGCCVGLGTWTTSLKPPLIVELLADRCLQNAAKTIIGLRQNLAESLPEDVASTFLTKFANQLTATSTPISLPLYLFFSYIFYYFCWCTTCSRLGPEMGLDLKR